MNNPPCLTRLCRVAVRRQMSVASGYRSILSRIDGLTIPLHLRLYLKFEGPLSEVDLTVSGVVSNERYESYSDGSEDDDDDDGDFDDADDFLDDDDDYLFDDDEDSDYFYECGCNKDCSAKSLRLRACCHDFDDTDEGDRNDDSEDED